MKIAVYDSKNQDRLLGQIDSPPYVLRNKCFEVALMDQIPAYKSVPDRLMQPCKMRKLTFYTDVRRVSDTKVIDEATTETTIIERKCFLTDAHLSDLMKLDRFYLPDETPVEQRRRLSEHRHTRDFY